MSRRRGFKHRLAVVTRLRDEARYDAALAEVESMLKDWPGNSHLHVLWASLVQLQEGPKHGLDEAKQALQEAVELGKTSPAAAIELGSFLDNVEDDPQAASRVYAEAVAAARRHLIDGLIGQARVFQQLDKTREFRRCILEVLHLARFTPLDRGTSAAASAADAMFDWLAGHIDAFPLPGPYAEQIQELLSEAATSAPS